MQTITAQPTTQIARDVLREAADPTILVANGYDVKLAVRAGQLKITDGIRSGYRSRVVSRTDKVRRIIILSESGFVTLEAIRWADALGISIVQLDREGRCLMTTPGLNGDSRLRKAQYVAQDNTALAMAIVQPLLTSKLTGQAKIVRDILRNDPEKIERQIAQIERADSLATMLACEGHAALNYWAAWSGLVHVPFIVSQLSMVPPHWYAFQARTSLKSPLRQGKDATDPINAMLNYAYAVCESEARIACHIYGLDPGIGFGHGEHRNVNSLAFDIQESLRPLAEHIVLSLLDTGFGPPLDSASGKPQYMKKRDFIEGPDGVCRLAERLTTILSAEVSSAVAHEAGIQAERIARLLASESPWKLRTSPYASKRHAAAKTPAKQMTLASDLKPENLISDKLWTQIQPLLPEDKPRSDRRHRTTPADDRACLAAIVAHERHGVAWKAIPASFGVSWNTPRRRLQTWKDSPNWDRILSLLP
jgi:CRISPR-associated endonuclease Cas1